MMIRHASHERLASIAGKSFRDAMRAAWTGKRQGVFIVTAFLTALSCVAGCQQNPKQVDLVREAQTPASAPRPYQLGIGDALDVKLFYHPELNESLIILSDGRITLQLVGSVLADGKSPDQLGRELEQKYLSAGLKDPRVAVIVRKSAGQKVYVGGEVQTPRLVMYDGRLSLLQAIFEAGGLRPTAVTSGVVLLRDNGQGGAQSRTVDLDELQKLGRDIALQPYDVVVVPKSTIAKINQFVEQYIVKVLPFSLTAGFNYVTGTTKTEVPITR